MSKHTPGPWEIHERSVVDACDWNEIHGPKGEHICSLGECAYHGADARLIAAAPEMLSMLKVIECYCYVSDKTRKEIKELIAKAEGPEST